MNNHGDDQEHPQTRRKELGKKSHGQPSSSPESTTDNVPHTERSRERKTEMQKQDQERSSQKCIAILVICVVLLTVAATVFALLYLTGCGNFLIKKKYAITFVLGPMYICLCTEAPDSQDPNATSRCGLQSTFSPGAVATFGLKQDYPRVL